MFLTDKVSHGHRVTNQHSGSGNVNTVRKHLCFDFNSGNCTYGKRCKFDHRCSFCHKFGHGAFNCRHAANKLGSSHAGSSGKNENNNETNRWDQYEKNQMMNNTHNSNNNNNRSK